MSNNLYQKNNNNNTRFGIIASFKRSIDSSHIETNRIHLISSICLINSNDIEMLLIKDNFNNKIFDLHENYYIFIVLILNNSNISFYSIKSNISITNIKFQQNICSHFRDVFATFSRRFHDVAKIIQK